MRTGTQGSLRKTNQLASRTKKEGRRNEDNSLHCSLVHDGHRGHKQTFQGLAPQPSKPTSAPGGSHHNELLQSGPPRLPGSG